METVERTALLVREHLAGLSQLDFHGENPQDYYALPAQVSALSLVGVEMADLSRAAEADLTETVDGYMSSPGVLEGGRIPAQIYEDLFELGYHDLYSLGYSFAEGQDVLPKAMARMAQLIPEFRAHAFRGRENLDAFVQGIEDIAEKRNQSVSEVIAFIKDEAGIEQVIAASEAMGQENYRQALAIIEGLAEGDPVSVNIHELRAEVLAYMYTFLAGDVLGPNQNEFRDLVTTGILKREHIVIITNDAEEAARVRDLLAVRDRVDILIAAQDALQDYDIETINTGLAGADWIDFGDFQAVPLDRAYEADRELAEAIISGV